MSVKTYRAWSLEEAFSALRSELGDDAEILRVRRLRSSGLRGLWSRRVVEVTARPPEGVPDESDAAVLEALVDRRSKGSPKRAEALRAYAAGRVGALVQPPDPFGELERAESDERNGIDVGGEATNGRIAHERTSSPSAAGTGSGATDDAVDGRVRLQRLAQALAVKHDLEGERLAATRNERETRARVREMREQAERDAALGIPDEEPEITAPLGPDPVARRYRLTPESGGAAANGRDRSNGTVAAHEAAGSDTSGEAPSSALPRVGEGGPRAATVEEMRRGFDELRGWLDDALRERADADAGTETSLADRLRRRLAAAGVAIDVVERVMTRVEAAIAAESDAIGLEGLADLARTTLESLLPSTIDSTHEFDRVGDRPRVIAFAGPTGVGKTTTIAKLAARARLQHDRRIGLVTADTYRIAAVEQLRTYARILDVPLRVVLETTDASGALEELADCDCVIVDTSGCSPRDADAIARLRALLEILRPDETHLVLSATNELATTMSAATRFRAIGIDRITVTKLDEAMSVGPIVTALVRLGLPLAWQADGQEVPDDLAPVAADELAARCTTSCDGAMEA